MYIPNNPYINRQCRLELRKTINVTKYRISILEKNGFIEDTPNTIDSYRLILKAQERKLQDLVEYPEEINNG